MPIRYKVLMRRSGDTLVSPYRNHHYEVGQWYEEPDLGAPGDNGCVRGLYAGPIESLLYRGLCDERATPYRCEVKGSSIKQKGVKGECWSRLKVLGPMSEAQVRRQARRAHGRLGYLLEEALYPVDPRKVEHGPVTPEDVALLKEWRNTCASMRGGSVRGSVGGSVRDSVWGSVRGSVWDSVWDSVRDSVWGSVRDSVRWSVWDSVWAYIGSLFPNIEKWSYIEHAPGAYPFQAGAKLWRSGLVPSHDGKKWRLHAGPALEVVWSDNKEKV